MTMLSVVLVVLSTLVIPTLSFPSTASKARIVSRQEVLASYDYVVIGGGTGGLTVADRLSEDGTKTVLVIERGPLDQREDAFVIPREFGTGPPQYWYNMSSIPQPGMNSRTFALQAGHVVGGGSAVNGMYMDRGSKADYDLWKTLGNPGWGWDDLLPYFKKSETFHPPEAKLAEEFKVTYNMSVRGTDGPIHLAYPPFLYPGVVIFQEAFKELGSHVPIDGAGGDALGAFWSPNAIDPSQMTRSFSRTGHFDRVATRTNLHLLTENAVTRIIFNGTAASGVEYKPNPDSRPMAVNARLEVILAAGGPHTPQILQLSGIGPAALLNRFEIPVVSNLPGVGQNFQDHSTTTLSALILNDVNPSPSNTTNSTWMAEQLILYRNEKKGVYTTAASNNAAFLPLHEHASRNRTNEIIAGYEAQDPAAQFPAGTDLTIIAGWKAQRDALVADIKAGTVATIEYAAGTYDNMFVVLEKPLARGSINIGSPNPFADPVIDFGVFTNPIDVEIFIEGIKAWRELLKTPSFKRLGAQIVIPTYEMTDDELKEYSKENGVPSIAHPCGTASMLPKELGGVVGPDLLVYGVTKLSIADASIIPFIPATHTCLTTYAIGEKAADMIKKRNS